MFRPMPIQRGYRSALLACLVLLGLQALIPSSAHGAASSFALEELVVPPGGADDETAGADTEQDPVLSGAFLAQYRDGRVQLTVHLPRGQSNDRPSGLLPVSGLHAAAP